MIFIDFFYLSFISNIKVFRHSSGLCTFIPFSSMSNFSRRSFSFSPLEILNHLERLLFILIFSCSNIHILARKEYSIGGTIREIVTSQFLCICISMLGDPPKKSIKSSHRNRYKFGFSVFVLFSFLVPTN